ncbi:MAG TPA: hypothetical protein VE377_26800 [Candidatus Dormibacteraeota bacterium]|nr:hypothetical protein [Candidatus Dormibacteraeota bacterium]
MRRMMVRSVGLCGVLLATVSASYAAGNDAKTQPGNSLPTDWSHRHVIFSLPSTPEQAARVQRDVRYQLQQRRQNGRPNASLQTEIDSSLPRSSRHRGQRTLHPDWAIDLGTGATVGAARYPAKFSFNFNVANCAGATQPDFVVYGTGLPGATGTQGSIIALTNLYTGCPTGPIPAAFWGYNTGGTVLSSPVLSLDGTQIAFVQTSAGTASLTLLKWKTHDGSIFSPTDISPVSASAYASCPTKPCMATFSLAANNSNSSVYYDYTSDMAWVGDDTGKLHEFTGVFNGTPAEVVTGGWPATVSANVLTSPVHDVLTGNTFVGDSGGFIYHVDSAGTVVASARLDFGLGFTEGPVIDSSIGNVYAFSSNDNLLNAGVFLLSTTFTAGATGTEAMVGLKSGGAIPIFDGTFDHTYITSPAGTGNMYVCGNPGGRPTIYQIPIASGVMGTPIAGPAVSTTNPAPCSPLTDIYNPNVTGAGRPQEWLFVGTQGSGTPAGCNGLTCVMNFKVTSWLPSTVYNVGQEILDSNLNIQVAENPGGTSGLTPPAWSTITYATTSDGAVHWRNQGPLSAVTPGAWAATTAYPGGTKLLDSNNNIEVAQLPGGISGGTVPTWGLTEGSTVTDGTITWVNLGGNTVAALQESGGTSGIIIDNLLNATGTSQIYFSTLNNQLCVTSGGTGGCAVQASQQDLK